MNELEHGTIDSDESGAEREETGAEQLAKPFDPTKIRVESKSMTVDLLVKRIDQKEIDLQPDFQRASGLWKDEAQSRLIESLLIRIPIPAFYLDATNEDRWIVVDGLQRLTVLKRFILDKALKLVDLEFLPFNGMSWDGLSRAMQRRIEETQVIVYLIQPGTPEEVKFNIFKRINTGGLPLSPQEIRHALNQGPAAEMLRELAESEDFLSATAHGLRAHRMTDRECVLRFLAFMMTSWEDYKSQDLDGFLHERMRELNRMTPDARGRLSERFREVMRLAFAIFGDDAFRKRDDPEASRGVINKALFETWSVNLAALSGEQARQIVERKDDVRARFIELMRDRQFDQSVTQGTGDSRRVRKRFSAVKELLEGVLR